MQVRLQHLALRVVHPARRLLQGGRDEILLEGGEGDRAAGFLGENLSVDLAWMTPLGVGNIGFPWLGFAFKF